MVNARIKDQALFAIVNLDILESTASLLLAQIIHVRMREIAFSQEEVTSANAQKVSPATSAR